MNAKLRTTLVAAALAGAAVMSAGCNDTRTASDRAAITPDSKLGSAITPDSKVASNAATSSRAMAGVDDAAITGKVKAAVMAEPGIRSLKIDVDTKDGVVTLTGSVDSADLKQKATQVAQNVNGVKSVVDNLTVKSTS